MTRDELGDEEPAVCLSEDGDSTSVIMENIDMSEEAEKEEKENDKFGKACCVGGCKYECNPS